MASFIEDIRRKNKLKEEQLPFKKLIDKINPSVLELDAIKNRCKMSLNEDNFIGFVLVYNECVEKITNRKVKHQEEGDSYKFANHYTKRSDTRELKAIMNEYAARRGGGVLDEYKVNLSSFNHGRDKFSSLL